MMKLIPFLLLVLSQPSLAQSELDDTGFGEIHLGKSFESLEPYISEVNVLDIPEYAWFAPMSLEDWLTVTEEDSASYFEMLETDRLIAESLGTKIVWCSLDRRKDANFFEYPIECVQLIFSENELKGIIAVFNKNEITEDAKETIFKRFESVFGPAAAENSAVSPPRKFDKTWKVNGRLIRVSDALSMEGGTGETVHILYWQE